MVTGRTAWGKDITTETFQFTQEFRGIKILTCSWNTFISVTHGVKYTPDANTCYHSCINICSQAKSHSTCRKPFLGHRPAVKCHSMKNQQGMCYTFPCRECDQDTHGHLHCYCRTTHWKLPKISKCMLWSESSTWNRNGAKADSWNTNAAFWDSSWLRGEKIRKKNQKEVTCDLVFFMILLIFLSLTSNPPFFPLSFSVLLFSILSPTSLSISHPFIAFPSCCLA